MDNKMFALLKNTFEEARGLSFNYFEDPQSDSDIEKIDLGIRAQLQHSSQHYNQLRRVAERLNFGEIVKLRDTFMLSYILFRAEPDDRSFYSVGPFRTLPFEKKDYQHIQDKNNLSYTKSEELQMLLQPVPCNILHIEAVSIAHNVLIFTHNLTETPIREENLELSESENPLPLVLVEDINARAKKIETTYMHEAKLMDYIAEGNYAKALTEAKYFLNLHIDRRMPSYVLSARSLLYATNTLFRKAAQSADVPPVYLDNISNTFAEKISVCLTHEQLNHTYMIMLEEYCHLCREYSVKNYSPIIQRVITYIRLNLNSDLSLKTIADAVSFSPVYISRKFKEELHKTPMTYVTEQRIHIAKHLLSDSRMSVQEIAHYVGISDWNYFTKIFKKLVGVTPTAYRKM